MTNTGASTFAAIVMNVVDDLDGMLLLPLDRCLAVLLLCLGSEPVPDLGALAVLRSAMMNVSGLDMYIFLRSNIAIAVAIRLRILRRLDCKSIGRGIRVYRLVFYDLVEYFTVVARDFFGYSFRVGFDSHYIGLIRVGELLKPSIVTSRSLTRLISESVRLLNALRMESVNPAISRRYVVVNVMNGFALVCVIILHKTVVVAAGALLMWTTMFHQGFRSANPLCIAIV